MNGEWREIGSAPTDGTLILGFDRDEDPCFAVVFRKTESYEIWDQVDKNTQKRRTITNSWWESLSAFIPTHWMPLPDPPA